MLIGIIGIYTARTIDHCQFISLDLKAFCKYPTFKVAGSRDEKWVIWDSVHTLFDLVCMIVTLSSFGLNSFNCLVNQL